MSSKYLDLYFLLFCIYMLTLWMSRVFNMDTDYGRWSELNFHMGGTENMHVFVGIYEYCFWVFTDMQILNLYYVWICIWIWNIYIVILWTKIVRYFIPLCGLSIQERIFSLFSDKYMHSVLLLYPVILRYCKSSSTDGSLCGSTDMLLFSWYVNISL